MLPKSYKTIFIIVLILLISFSENAHSELSLENISTISNAKYNSYQFYNYVSDYNNGIVYFASNWLHQVGELDTATNYNLFLANICVNNKINQTAFLDSISPESGKKALFPLAIRANDNSASLILMQYNNISFLGTPVSGKFVSKNYDFNLKNIINNSDTSKNTAASLPILNSVFRKNGVFTSVYIANQLKDSRVYLLNLDSNGKYLNSKLFYDYKIKYINDTLTTVVRSMMDGIRGLAPSKINNNIFTLILLDSAIYSHPIGDTLHNKLIDEKWYFNSELIYADENNNVIWNKRDTLFNNCIHLISSKDGGVLVISKLSYAIRITKVNEDGDILWTKSHTTKVIKNRFFLTINNAIENKNGDILLSGFIPTYNVMDNITDTTTGYRYLAKIDKNGNFLWDDIYADNKGKIPERFIGIHETETPNTYVLISKTRVRFAFDLWEDKTADVQEAQATENIVYPNPAGDYLNIKDIENISGDVEINNIAGKTVMQVPVASKIDIRILPAGVYYVTINGKTEKFVKE